MREKELLLNAKKILIDKGLRVLSGTLSLATMLSMMGASMGAARQQNNNKFKEITKSTSSSVSAIYSQTLSNIILVKEVIDSEPTMEDKIAWILDNYHVSAEQFDMVAAGMISESPGDGLSYDGAYNTTTTLYHRIHDVRFVNEFGPTIYDQFVAKNQFSVYAYDLYQKYMGRTDLPGYQAVVDMLFSGVPSHNYIRFNANWYDVKVDYEILVPRGNKFHTPYSEERRIEVPTTPYKTWLFEKTFGNSVDNNNRYQEDEIVEVPFTYPEDGIYIKNYEVSNKEAILTRKSSR